MLKASLIASTISDYFGFLTVKYGNSFCIYSFVTHIMNRWSR